MLHVVSAEGPPLGDERSASDLIGEAAWGGLGRRRPGGDSGRAVRARLLRLFDAVGGDSAAKFIKHRLGVVIVGDIEPWIRDSEALRGFVRESNRGRSVWFAEDRAVLQARLAPPTDVAATLPPP